ncbi:c-type cytochrome [Zoogloea dura]|uniref:Cytochrome c n=1 Tax=Zoogloea dura TaxID=2728840 RepID=A0A848FZT2_9RHOO|nr:cytochrome c [Zoogloea dura]NML24379.1 cytochrome c [Zoogloea dura]
MKRTLIALAFLTVVGGASGAAALYLGVINVAADEPHHPLIHHLLEFARERSIAARAADLKPPVDLHDPERVRRGSGNYDAMCAGCHLSPSAPDSEIRKGLYPKPPRLADKPGGMRDDTRIIQARQFWVIKHGIKASGMPAWSVGGMEDDAIWDLVAFLQQLPGLTADSYAALVASSDGHSHVRHGQSAEPPVEKKGHPHPPGFKHGH